MKSIDVNSDLGEGFGPYRIAPDADLMPLITSANIACGAHAGDPLIMDETVSLAQTNKVRVGAHIGYPDRENFGRRMMTMTLKELELMTITQLGALAAIAAHRGAQLTHANFHGALGNLSFADADVARTLIKAMKSFDPSLKFIGLADTEASRIAEEESIEVVYSFLADRGYSAPGRLAPRGTVGALLHEPEDIRLRVAETLSSGQLKLTTGEAIPVKIDSILVHSDTPNALKLAHAIRQGIADAAFEIGSYAI
ncbi:5-oxoprolinase subunit PxpA [uncultured Cohaesibacter sp.]|uniref:LamB/YcsF family protein n=1 Tax=uncultured Cohaesibacter sp. TaxID=1002546 RepID=UPI002AABA671|nr:5-oxoprolinase subunit PxpA [uncultured Cohaesibacter sp.]